MSIQNDKIPQNMMILYTIIGGIVCIYLTELPYIGGLFAIVTTLLGVLYATNTTRHIDNSSINSCEHLFDYILIACGVISSLAGISLSEILGLKYLFPILSLVFAVFMGFCVVIVSRYILKKDDPIMMKGFISISVSTMISVLGMSTFIASSFDTNIIYITVLKNGYLILQIIMLILMKQIAYNASKGPNENQRRTLTLATLYAFLMLIVLSILSMPQCTYWYIYTLICIIGATLAFKNFTKYVKHQAASIRYNGFYERKNIKGEL